MGLFDRVRERKAAEAQTSAGASVAQRRAELEANLAEIEEMIEQSSFEGVSDPEAESPVRLKPGERVFMLLTNSDLIEVRKTTQRQAGRAGVSFRVMKGVTLRSGRSQGTSTVVEKPTIIDTDGTVVITNKRVVYLGPGQTREWSFDNLIGHLHEDLNGDAYWTTISVSNRQKASGFLYQDKHAATVRFRLELALAHYEGGDVSRVAAMLRQDRAAIVAELGELAAATDEQPALHKARADSACGKCGAPPVQPPSPICPHCGTRR